ncbi:MAG: SPASM domain-containing protein [Rhodanobacteraceae bacterium]|nr:SPASM domain-containing protein [Rhodanobacteraceae bacterium]
MSDALLAARTLPLPRVLWIELTSRCPFDCVFCTRASLRGAGEHLDFELYQRLIGELDRPRTLRLNYAGESGHYPRLAEAVALAAATGAEVELVSALASLKPERLQAALEAGLGRLTVSLHTLDAARFAAIYRFGSLEAMHARIRQALDWRARAPWPFVLDLAFVAMERNLDELPAVAAYAAAHGIPVLAVHPLIGRDPLPLGPAAEHTADGQLDAGFSARLVQAVAAARAAAPELAIQLSSFELQPTLTLAAHPQPWPWPLPPGARIGGCDQSPFDSVHILADGRVVACEVTEKTALGDLNLASLREIWHSRAYREFRAAHLAGQAQACRTCVYKTAYRPIRPQPRIEGARPPAAQLLRGWHADDGSGARWCGSEGALLLPRPHFRRHLRLRGMLAQAPPAATFSVRVDGHTLHQQAVAGPENIDLRLPLPAAHGSEIVVEIDCPGARSPQALGAGSDVRELGFALIAAELVW